jgi:hypothetical protein
MTEEIEEKRISFQTSVLAKLKGFKEKCDAWFWFDTENRNPEKNGQLFIQTHRNRDNTPIGVSAPNQSLLQKFLREVHGIHINVDFGLQWGYQLIHIGSNLKFNENFVDGKNWLTYEDALEEGLYQALLLL